MEKYMEAFVQQILLVVGVCPKSTYCLFLVFTTSVQALLLTPYPTDWVFRAASPVRFGPWQRDPWVSGARRQDGGTAALPAAAGGTQLDPRRPCR